MINCIPNKKILFIANVNLNVDIGYANKIYGQKNGFEQLGMNCLLVAKGITLNENKTIFNSLLRKLSPKAEMLATSYMLMKHDKGIVYIYLRYPRSDFLLYAFLFLTKHYFEIQTIASEIPTFPYESEFQKTIRGNISKNIDYIFRQKCANMIDKFVSIGYNGKIFNRETIKIANGIDITAYPKHSPSSTKGCLNLIGVGNISNRHGYDRVLRGLRKFLDEDTINTTFFIVGGGPAIGGLRLLSKELRLDGNVVFVDSIYGKELDSLFDKCHVAVGNLAFHRINVSETSALKEREYCARGIPFIMASHDPVMTSICEFIYTVPGNDSSVNISEVYEYVNNSQNKNVSTHLREFASNQLTWARQFRHVFK